jgi:hypothetical protein
MKQSPLPGFEFHLEHALTPQTLTMALAQLFSVPEHSVLVVPEIEGDEDLTSVGVLCSFHFTGGDYPLHLSVYPQQSHALEQPVAAAVLARLLNCSCLISDASPDPFAWLQVNPSGQVAAVSVDPEGLDRNELCLTR